MAAAIAVALPAFALARARGASFRKIAIPPISRLPIDRSLLLGSAVFGVGWGLSGICPGPGLVLLVGGDSRAYIFAGGVAVGIFVAGAFTRNRRTTISDPANSEVT
jgi:uncharacterized membrane protein YedE/YeeE